jgi:hypothetical protein
MPHVIEHTNPYVPTTQLISGYLQKHINLLITLLVKNKKAHSSECALICLPQKTVYYNLALIASLSFS